jgi:hypothetical protein
VHWQKELQVFTAILKLKNIAHPPLPLVLSIATCRSEGMCQCYSYARGKPEYRGARSFRLERLVSVG